MSLIQPTPIVKPFCNSGTSVSPPVGSDTFVANQETGFPASQSTPLPAGKPVNRAQMNGVLQLYSNLILWMNAGGVWTFDEGVSAANGGYPAGVILYSESDNSWQRSLINNNTANFITTPTFLNDGINWSSAVTVGALSAVTINTSGNIISAGAVQSNGGNFYSANAGVDVKTDITTREGHFYATQFGQNVAMPADPNVAFWGSKPSIDRAIELLTDVIPGIRMINNADNSDSRIGLIPGKRPTAAWTGVGDTPIVVQSDFNAFSGTANDSLGSPFTYTYVTLPSTVGVRGMRIIQGTISGDLSTTRTFTLPFTFDTFSVCFTAAGSIFPIFNASIVGNTFTASSNIHSTNTNYLIIGGT